MIKKIMSLALLACANWVMAQSPTLTWAKQFTGTTVDVGSSITTDAADNVYTVGRFNGTIDLDPNAGVYNVTSNTPAASDIFISKIDQNGNFVWGYAIGGSSSDAAFGVDIDASGNVIVVGTFTNTVDFDPSGNVVSLTSNGGIDLFILKLDASGTFAWAKSIGGTGVDEAISVGTDGSGNIYLAGDFSNTVDFDPGVGTYNQTSAGLSDGFSLKLNSAGEFQWVNRVGSTGTDYAMSIAVGTSGNCYVVGGFQGTLSAGVLGSLAVTGFGGNDGFLQVLTSSGTLNGGGALIGTAGDEMANAVAIDETNNAVVLAGRYSGNIPTYGFVNAGGYDIFIQKFSFDPTTKALAGGFWGYGIGSTSNQEATSITTDPLTGNIYVAGYIQGSSIDFDPSSGISLLSATGSSGDGFIAGYSKTGSFLFAHTIGNANYDNVSCISASNLNVYVTSYFQGTIDFDPVGTYNMTSGGSGTIFDAYSLKYSACSPPSAPTIVTSAANRTICTGGSVALEVAGTMTGTISWYSASTGGTFLGSGPLFTTPNLNSTTTYYAQDSTCYKSARTAVTVTVNNYPTITANANATSLCFGDTLVLYGSGAQNFSWNNGVTNNVGFVPTITGPTTYIMNGSSNGCAGTPDTITVTVNLTDRPTVSTVYVPLSLTGFDNDIVANGSSYQTTTTTSVDADVDGCRFIDSTYIQFGVPTRFLPTGGAFYSQSTPAVPFQLASYNTNNSLTLPAYLEDGTLTLNTPTSMNSFYLLATSGGGVSNIDVVVNFTDGSSQPTVNLTIDDWFNASNYALRGVGRMYNNALGFQGPNDVNPRIYQYLVPIDPAYTSKVVSSVYFVRNNSGPMKVQIMGMTATVSKQEFCASIDPLVADLVATGSNLAWYNSTGVLMDGTEALADGDIFSVTQTLNGCPSEPVEVLVSLLPTPNIVAPSVTICDGSSVQLTGSGANSYSWSTGETTNTITVSPSSTVSYLVTGIDLAGCSGEAEVSVTVNLLPTVTATVNPANATVCSGGQLTLTGTGALTYSWTNGITNGTAFTPATSGNYTVTGTDANGCTGTASKAVTVNPLPLVSANAVPANATVCAGGQVTLSGGGALTYTWNNGVINNSAFVPSASGSYTVTGTDANGCTNTATRAVTVNPLPNVSAISDTDTLCIGSSANLTASGASTYSWSSGGNTAVVTISPNATTTYTVTGTDVNGCQDAATITQLVSSCGAVGIDQIASDEKEVAVYPNPNNGKFVITTGIPSASILVTDILGNEIFFVKSSGETMSIDLSSQANGMYFVRVIANGVQTVKRVIKNN